MAHCFKCYGFHEPPLGEDCKKMQQARARDEEHARRKEVVRLAEAFAVALLAKDREVIVPSWATCHAFRVAELFEFDARRYMETGERPGSTKAPAARQGGAVSENVDGNVVGYAVGAEVICTVCLLDDEGEQAGAIRLADYLGDDARPSDERCCRCGCRIPFPSDSSPAARQEGRDASQRPSAAESEE